ncbi:hypothetical protein BLIN101_00730 [Brevibacterium linens]|uniref:Uncharacterized protein n=1 Tax=Brevibacterium linens TaxID=1703 RepID=A0A2H1I2D3_BRELN|nr:hypothetical protein BLIN101_00730 [Brevibacterium linens]
MMRIDTDSAERRPILSPICPQMKPPMGRTTKDTAKTAKVDRRARLPSDLGKKTSEIVVAK